MVFYECTGSAIADFPIVIEALIGIRTALF